MRGSAFYMNETGNNCLNKMKKSNNSFTNLPPNSSHSIVSTTDNSFLIDGHDSHQQQALDLYLKTQKLKYKIISGQLF